MALEGFNNFTTDCTRLAVVHRVNSILDQYYSQWRGTLAHPYSQRRGTRSTLLHTRQCVSFVYDIHRDRSHMPHRAAPNQTEVEAKWLHSTVLARDPNTSFIWFVLPSDLMELQRWELQSVLLIPIPPPDLLSWSQCIRAPALSHHAGPTLGAFKMLVPLLRIPEPVMLVDTDTVALSRWSDLWDIWDSPRRGRGGSIATGMAAGVTHGTGVFGGDEWVLVHGEEHKHINSGMLMWQHRPDKHSWLACIALGMSFLQSAVRKPQRISDPRNVRYGEQSALVYLCDASRNASWRLETGCGLACAAHGSELYSTGCSPSWNQSPRGGYHVR